MIIIIISFMQGTYTHIPETNYVPREHGVAAILLFLFMVLISLLPVLKLLYFYISTFRNMCAVPNMAVFCSSLTSWFPGMLLTYFLNVFEIVPVAPIIIIIIIIETLNDLYSSPNIVRVLKSRRMRWAGHVARMEERRGVFGVMVGKPDRKRPLGRPRRRWEDNIKIPSGSGMWGYGLDRAGSG